MGGGQHSPQDQAQMDRGIKRKEGATTRLFGQDPCPTFQFFYDDSYRPQRVAMRPHNDAIAYVKGCVGIIDSTCPRIPRHRPTSLAVVRTTAQHHETRSHAISMLIIFRSSLTVETISR